MCFSHLLVLWSANIPRYMLEYVVQYIAGLRAVHTHATAQN